MNPECINCCNKEEKERYRETVDIQRIGDIIYFEMDITEQDWWLDDMVNSGNYTPTKGTEND